METNHGGDLGGSVTAPGEELLPRWQVVQEDTAIEFRPLGRDHTDGRSGIGEPRKIGADQGSDRHVAHSGRRR
jgi:hypothetical protein